MALRNASDFLGAYGGGVRVERRQCAEHGGYAAKSVLRGVWTGCPACRKLEAADEMAAYAETLRRGAMRDALEKRIGRSGIAPRFRNCRIENYAVSDSIPGMARAKAAAAEYAANFADVLQTGRSMIFSGRRARAKTTLPAASPAKSSPPAKARWSSRWAICCGRSRTVSAAAAARRGRSGFS